MERIKGIDTNGNYLYEGDGQVDQEIQKATNENFLNMIGEEDTDDKLISLNKACEWLKNKFPSDYYMFNGEFIEDFEKAMEGDNK